MAYFDIVPAAEQQSAWRKLPVSTPSLNVRIQSAEVLDVSSAITNDGADVISEMAVSIRGEVIWAGGELNQVPAFPVTEIHLFLDGPNLQGSIPVVLPVERVEATSGLNHYRLAFDKSLRLSGIRGWSHILSLIATETVYHTSTESRILLEILPLDLDAEPPEVEAAPPQVITEDVIEDLHPVHLATNGDRGCANLGSVQTLAGERCLVTNEDGAFILGSRSGDGPAMLLLLRAEEVELPTFDLKQSVRRNIGIEPQAVEEQEAFFCDQFVSGYLAAGMYLMEGQERLARLLPAEQPDHWHLAFDHGPEHEVVAEVVSESARCMAKVLWRMWQTKEAPLWEQVTLRLLAGSEEVLGGLPWEFRIILQLGVELFDSVWKDANRITSGRAYRLGEAFGQLVYQITQVISPYSGLGSGAMYVNMSKLEFLRRAQGLAIVKQISPKLPKIVNETIQKLQRF